MFSYALQNNANNVAGLQKTLLAVVPHTFGDHGHCSDSWCGHLKKSSGYKHSGLPYGKDLSCRYTKALLTRLFQGLSDSAEKLAPLGSSQVNEALNNTIASKAPKSRHYGGSESQDFRTAAAVLQKNEGQQYLPHAIIEAGGSPSAPLQQRARYKDKVALTRSERASSKSSKLRRRLLRQNHSAHLASAELREGTTYRSGCSLLPADLDTFLLFFYFIFLLENTYSTRIVWKKKQTFFYFLFYFLLENTYSTRIVWKKKQTWQATVNE